MLPCIARISYGGWVRGGGVDGAPHAQEVVDSEKTAYKYHATVKYICSLVLYMH